MDIPSTPVIADLILKLQKEYSIHDFVETGTYLGATAVWASQRFERVYTIEASKELWERAVSNHASIGNIEFLYGDSWSVLDRLAPRLVSPIFYWLDAHWSAGNTFGEGAECPLLDELAIIQKQPQAAFILIDDADMFLSPPPRPHSPDAWPDIYSVLYLLKQEFENYVVVFENVIICVPTIARSFLASYCQDRNTARSKERNRVKISLFQRILSRLRTF
ncbi:MAG: hypothetical protein R6X21_09920 [Candidatus Aminicenantes bacterium]